MENSQKMTPKEYEQLYLPKLNGQYEQATAWLKSNTLGARKSVASQEVTTIIGHLQEYEKHFLTYESLAQYLNNAGLPQMSKRLVDILDDIRNAIQTYQQLYQNALAMETWHFPVLPWF